MRILITAGPTREYIDTVRFLSNASSGRMGCAIAAAAIDVGIEVTLLLGPVVAAAPKGCEIVRFVSVGDLKGELHRHFQACDALVMTAAVGDFRPEKTLSGKMSRAAGPVTLRLVPTEDLLAGVAATKRPSQVVMAFAVEDGPPAQAQAKAQEELAAKGADFVVVNTPRAMGAAESDACILSRDGSVLSWDHRTKDDLAREIVALLKKTVWS